MEANREVERTKAENELAYAIRDGYPVTRLHTLVIPKRHVASYFELGRPEANACNGLLEALRDEICQWNDTVSGFHIGIKVGEDAGQTIFHCHLLLIPRRPGDVENPRGDVGGVIPGKQSY